MANRAMVDAVKQAMARVELYDCHKNWKKWNTPAHSKGENK